MDKNELYFGCVEMELSVGQLKIYRLLPWKKIWPEEIDLGFVSTQVEILNVIGIKLRTTF